MRAQSPNSGPPGNSLLIQPFAFFFFLAFCFLIETFLGVKILYQVREKADFAVSLVSGLHLERKTLRLSLTPVLPILCQLSSVQ